MIPSLLDCTLRDGAHVIDGFFTSKNATSILNGLSNANIDFIEAGFLEPASARTDTTYFASIGDFEEFYKNINKQNSQIGLMLRTDRCSLSTLQHSGILDFVRIAFYPEHGPSVLKYAEKALSLNYDVYLNLIGITNYDNKEIEKILQLFKGLSISGVSIVDTYGCLDLNELNNLVDLFDRSISSDLKLGLHLHENLSRSMHLISAFHSKQLVRDKVLDASLAGMGRIPGNVPTELVADFLNKFGSKDYLIDILFDTALSCVYPYKKVNPWGYMPIYAYSAMLRIDRTYPEFFQTYGLNESENIKCQSWIKRNVKKKRFSLDAASLAIDAQGYPKK